MKTLLIAVMLCAIASAHNPAAEQKAPKWSADKLYIACDYGDGLSELAQSVLAVESMSPADIAEFERVTLMTVQYEKSLGGQPPKGAIDPAITKASDKRLELLKRAMPTTEVVHAELDKVVDDICKELSLDQLPRRAETMDEIAELRTFLATAKKLRVEGMVRARLLRRLVQAK
jgi:hypothetical protein